MVTQSCFGRFDCPASTMHPTFCSYTDFYVEKSWLAMQRGGVVKMFAFHGTQTQEQGDQIGRIFANRAIVYIGRKF
jgi:hypothetical protein